LLSATICLILLVGCKPKSEPLEPSGQQETAQSLKITEKDIAEISYTEYALSDTSEDVTRDWVKFHELNAQIEVLKRADLSFFKDDKAILEGFLTDLINELPEQLNDTSIIVRLTALKTSIYKLEGSAILEKEEKEDLLNNIKDVLISHTNLIFQINKKLEKEAQKIEKPS